MAELISDMISFIVSFFFFSVVGMALAKYLEFPVGSFMNNATIFSGAAVGILFSLVIRWIAETSDDLEKIRDKLL